MFFLQLLLLFVLRGIRETSILLPFPQLSLFYQHRYPTDLQEGLSTLLWSFSELQVAYPVCTGLFRICMQLIQSAHISFGSVGSSSTIEGKKTQLSPPLFFFAVRFHCLNSNRCALVTSIFFSINYTDEEGRIWWMSYLQIRRRPMLRKRIKLRERKYRPPLIPRGKKKGEKKQTLATTVAAVKKNHELFASYSYSLFIIIFLSLYSTCERRKVRGRIVYCSNLGTEGLLVLS